RPATALVTCLGPSPLGDILEGAGMTEPQPPASIGPVSEISRANFILLRLGLRPTMDLLRLHVIDDALRDLGLAFAREEWSPPNTWMYSFATSQGHLDATLPTLECPHPTTAVLRQSVRAWGRFYGYPICCVEEEQARVRPSPKTISR